MRKNCCYQLCVRHARLCVGVCHVDRPALDVLQALGLLPVLGVKHVLTAIVVILKIKV